MQAERYGGGGLIRAVRFHWLRLLRLKDQPQSVAGGFALGIMIGCIPFFGIQSILALSLAVLLKINKVACLIGSVWTNPVTAIPVYWTNYRIGLWFTGRDGVSFERFTEILGEGSRTGLLDLGADLFAPLGIGCGLAALILGPLSYLAVLQGLKFRQAQRRAKARNAARPE